MCTYHFLKKKKKKKKELNCGNGIAKIGENFFWQLWQ